MVDIEEEPEPTSPGSCMDCHAWTSRGQVVGERHGCSGAGDTLVRCAACAAKAKAAS